MLFNQFYSLWDKFDLILLMSPFKLKDRFSLAFLFCPWPLCTHSYTVSSAFVFLFFTCKNVWKLHFIVPEAVVCFPVALCRQRVECELAALSARCIWESWGGQADKQQELWEECRSGVTLPVRGATQVHMSYTWNGLRSSSWKPSQGVKNHRGVTSWRTGRHPGLSLPDPLSLSLAVTSLYLSDPVVSLGCSRRSHRRCGLMARDCQNGCNSDCRAVESWKLFFLVPTGCFFFLCVRLRTVHCHQGC